MCEPVGASYVTGSFQMFMLILKEGFPPPPSMPYSYETGLKGQRSHMDIFLQSRQVNPQSLKKKIHPDLFDSYRKHP